MPNTTLSEWEHPDSGAMSGKQLPVVAQLRALADQPEAAVQLAVSILEGEHGKDVLLAALKVLTEHPTDAARPALRRLYERYSRDKGRHDQGGYFRRAVLDALRPVARPADAGWLAQACMTYEFWPPDFAEDAVLIRAAALVALVEVDEEAARHHAARLLVDPFTARMTGEPAVSAARVLGALGETLPLYLIACQTMPHDRVTGSAAVATVFPEVTAECLRQLTALPRSLVEPLLEGYAATASSVIRMGLFDLLLNHAEGPLGRAYLARFLEETTDADIYRYLVMSIVLAGREEPLHDLRQAAYRERRRAKQEILLEAATILAHRVEFAELAAHLRLAIRRQL
ncbi:MAG TPA: hypothetical protein DCL15_13320 [Chloroflexi bacterium]|nr:hypothetical protein [Chloroflexota bacterium]HHW84792.1 hypothetical protein [Chloroflexota bacterium]